MHDKDNLLYRSLRFRWYQGFLADNSYAPEWAIDNVFIGMSCMDFCLGHGTCSNTMMCSCDQNHHGDSCVPSIHHPTHLSEDFDGINKESPVKGQTLIGMVLIKFFNADTFWRISSICGICYFKHYSTPRLEHHHALKWQDVIFDRKSRMKGEYNEH